MTDRHVVHLVRVWSDGMAEVVHEPEELERRRAQVANLEAERLELLDQLEAAQTDSASAKARATVAERELWALKSVYGRG